MTGQNARGNQYEHGQRIGDFSRIGAQGIVGCRSVYDDALVREGGLGATDGTRFSRVVGDLERSCCRHRLFGADHVGDLSLERARWLASFRLISPEPLPRGYVVHDPLLR